MQRQIAQIAKRLAYLCNPRWDGSSSGASKSPLGENKLMHIARFPSWSLTEAPARKNCNELW